MKADEVARASTSAGASSSVAPDPASGPARTEGGNANVRVVSEEVGKDGVEKDQDGNDEDAPVSASAPKDGRPSNQQQTQQQKPEEAAAKAGKVAASQQDGDLRPASSSAAHPLSAVAPIEEADDTFSIASSSALAGIEEEEEAEADRPTPGELAAIQKQRSLAKDLTVKQVSHLRRCSRSYAKYHCPGTPSETVAAAHLELYHLSQFLELTFEVRLLHSLLFPQPTLLCNSIIL